jgi:toxin-antitoxin system PIN domain toxin
MQLVDSNVWLALALSKHKFHAVARSWLAQTGRRDALFCRATQQSFLRLLTTTAVLAPYGIPPLRNLAAWSVYEGLRANERIAWVEEPNGVDVHWKKLAATAQASPKLWMDAYLAAFALAGGHQLVTTDTAFRQFRRLDLLVLSPKG